MKLLSNNKTIDIVYLPYKVSSTLFPAIAIAVSRIENVIITDNTDVLTPAMQ